MENSYIKKVVSGFNSLDDHDPELIIQFKKALKDSLRVDTNIVRGGFPKKIMTPDQLSSKYNTSIQVLLYHSIVVDYLKASIFLASIGVMSGANSFRAKYNSKKFEKIIGYTPTRIPPRDLTIYSYGELMHLTHNVKKIEFE